MMQYDVITFVLLFLFSSMKQKTTGPFRFFLSHYFRIKNSQLVCRNMATFWRPIRALAAVREFFGYLSEFFGCFFSQGLENPGWWSAALRNEEEGTQPGFSHHAAGIKDALAMRFPCLRSRAGALKPMRSPYSLYFLRRGSRGFIRHKSSMDDVSLHVRAFLPAVLNKIPRLE